MPTTREPVGAPARWVLAVATVLAVLGMHSLMSPSPAAAGPAVHHGTSVATSVAADHDGGAGPMVTVDADRTTSAMVAGAPDCTAGCGGQGSGHEGHTLAHLCLAVLAGFLTVLTALALARSALPVLAAVRRRALVVSGGWRAPPWVHPSLAQLSVLRV